MAEYFKKVSGFEICLFGLIQIIWLYLSGQDGMITGLKIR